MIQDFLLVGVEMQASDWLNLSVGVNYRERPWEVFIIPYISRPMHYHESLSFCGKIWSSLTNLLSSRWGSRLKMVAIIQYPFPLIYLFGLSNHGLTPHIIDDLLFVVDEKVLFGHMSIESCVFLDKPTEVINRGKGPLSISGKPYPRK